MTPSAAGNEKIFCPYCRTVSDFDFPFYGRTYYHCLSCDLIFVRRKDDIKTTLTYYQNSYFDDHTEDQMSGHRTNIYRHVLDALEEHKNPGSLLDLGCGCGFFLKEAKERGWQVSGVDPSEKSIAYAKSLIGDAAVCGTLDDIPNDRRFDAITMINVLDHMCDACQQLQKVQDLLAPEGILYLRFPNGIFHSFIMRLSLRLSAKQFMNAFLVFHEYAITPRAIRRCLGDMGFVDIRVLNAHLTGDNLCFNGFRPAILTKIILSNLLWGFFKSLEKLSDGKWLWGPSLQVLARKGSRGCRL
jgi:2-polyprenyl-3-methyl-5-hydroxy-6-metoxy-1,4-benzoquinol methylase